MLKIKFKLVIPYITYKTEQNTSIYDFYNNILEKRVFQLINEVLFIYRKSRILTSNKYMNTWTFLKWSVDFFLRSQYYAEKSRASQLYCNLSKFWDILHHFCFYNFLFF